MSFEIDIISLKGRFYSKNLKRKVVFRWVAPADYQAEGGAFPVLLMNDGQDFRAMTLENTLINAFNDATLSPFIYIGIETDHRRMQEYGIAGSPDYKGRGDRATAYSKFIVEEFIPFLKREFKVSEKASDWIFCGMSLGALSAFDIAYSHPEHFRSIGVFSGSFWWRSKPYVPGDMEDRSRMVLSLVSNKPGAKDMKFWFQCGTQDEIADRNKNGVIDSIDDTKALIRELQKKGYSYPGDITYVEIKGGRHDLPTWARVFPDFLKWAFPVVKDVPVSIPIESGPSR